MKKYFAVLTSLALIGAAGAHSVQAVGLDLDAEVKVETKANIGTNSGTGASVNASATGTVKSENTVSGEAGANGETSSLINIQVGVPMRVMLKTDNGTAMVVMVEKDADGNQVIVDGTVRVETKEKIEADDEGLRVGSAEREVKIMPSTASARAIEVLGAKYDRVELKVVGRKAVYRFVKNTPAKLFGFIKVTLEVTATVDAEAEGEVKVSRPWWSFLARA